MIEAGKKLIRGVGYNDGKYIQVKGSDVEYAYNIWRKMLDRCYDDGFRKGTNTYSDCYVSEDFKQFSRFYEWAKNQVGFRLENYHLDKDILVKGNKEYSSDRCVFVPRALNSFLTSRKNHRGSSKLVGVSFHSRDLVYQARVSDGFGKRIHLGVFDNEEDAFQAYKVGKEAVAKRLVEFYSGLVDEIVVKALLNYTVSKDD